MTTGTMLSANVYVCPANQMKSRCTRDLRVRRRTTSGWWGGAASAIAVAERLPRVGPRDAVRAQALQVHSVSSDVQVHRVSIA
jgi:hypothetical protein